MPSTTPRWLRIIASQLLLRDGVRRVRVRRYGIDVQFVSGLTDNYSITPCTGKKSYRHHIVDERMMRLSTPLQLFCEFQPNPLDKNDPARHHIVLDRGQFKRASFIEQQLAKHRLYAALEQFYAGAAEFPPHAVQDYLEKIRNTNIDDFYYDDCLDCCVSHGNAAWRRLSEHFFPKPKRYKSRLWNALQIVCAAPRTPISAFEIHRRMRLRVNITSPHPGAYFAFIKRQNIQGPVVDLHPEMGNKAIACAVAGIPYYAVWSPTLDLAIQRGLTTYTSCTIEKYTGQPAELLFCDHDMRKFDIADAIPHLTTAKHMLAFAAASERYAACAQSHPTAVIKVFRHVSQRRSNQPDFLLWW